MKKPISIIFSALLLLSLLAGCTPGATPAPGGVLNLYGIDPYTLDPAVSSEMTSHDYITQIYSGLVALDENLEPAPDIAERWKVSDDGRTYTFYLRKDVKFQDGRGVTAADFKYSWERACDPATGSQTAASFLGDIVGAKEVLAGNATEISGLRVINDYTLEATIDAPKSYFLYKLSYTTAYVVDRANVEQGGVWWLHPNGTGPFHLKQWDVGSRLVLEKNQLYYGQQARVDSVDFHLWSGVPMDLYETGKIDVTDVGSLYIDKAQDPRGSFYQQLSVAPELSFFFIGFNATGPPFDDPGIRRAFSLAIDKDKIVSILFKGTVQRADGILPPGLPGYNENLVGLGFDPAQARKLINDSEYGDVSNLPPITITTAGWGGLISPELTAVVNEWRVNLGVEVTVRQLEPERFLYHLKEEKDEMFDSGWVADYPHPQDFLEVLFRTGTDANYGGYSNPEVDSLLLAAGAEPDYAKSLVLYQQAEEKLVSDAACVPLWFGRNYVLVKPYVGGYRLNPLSTAMLSEVSVEPH